MAFSQFYKKIMNEEPTVLQTSFTRKIFHLTCREVFDDVADTAECFLKFLQAALSAYLLLLNPGADADAVFLQSRSQPGGSCSRQSSTLQAKQTPQPVRVLFSLLFPKCRVTFLREVQSYTLNFSCISQHYYFKVVKTDV